jgi:hypothetical protein
MKLGLSNSKKNIITIAIRSINLLKPNQHQSLLPLEPLRLKMKPLLMSQWLLLKDLNLQHLRPLLYPLPWNLPNTKKRWT